MPALPRMARFRQEFPPSAPVHIPSALAEQFATIRPRLKPRATVAVGVGSRGISNLATIVKSFLDLLKSAGADPFIFPAMGSHGGATPEGQTELLASYGITAEEMGVPIHASMEVRQVGVTSAAAPVYSSVAALAADHIVLINRVKPHTDFFGPLGSGVIKMSVIGLGKKEGAAAMHISASRFGHEKVIREMARIVIEKTPILCGVAILENHFHDTAVVKILRREEIFEKEPELLEQARRLMPLLPMDEIDLLIVDRIGKNISGAGLDPNVVGRGVSGYTSGLAPVSEFRPFVRRIFVRDLTPETHGNAIGIGNADVTTTRLVRGMDNKATYVNALTALTPQAAKAPIHFDTDRECVEWAIDSLAISDGSIPKVVRIQDTLNLQTILLGEGMPVPAGLTRETEFEPMRFGGDGNLV